MTIFISHDNCYTFKRFLKDCGHVLRKDMHFIFYADLPYRKSLPNDLALFTDLERLNDTQIALAITAEKQLQAAGACILNAPSRVLRRYDLLQKMFQDGINEFRAYRLHEDRAQFKYPVFLRLEREHQGSLSTLLNNPNEVKEAIQTARERGFPEDNLLLVEYCDVRDQDGLFRKYSAFLIGERCFPRHIIAGGDWMSKSPDKVYENDETCLHQESEYLTKFPHENEVRQLFQSAGIEYGRIDYSLKNGKIQVWEINTNPNIIPEATLASGRRDAQERVHENVRDAFQQLLPVSPQTGSAPFVLPEELRQQFHINNVTCATHPLQRQLRSFESKRIKRIIKHRVLKKLKPRPQD